MANHPPDETHLSETQLVAYLAHELEGKARRRVESHLVHCADCRSEVADAREVLGAPRRRRWTMVAPVAAAAAVATLFLSGVLDDGGVGGIPDRPVHREAPAAVDDGPVAVSPSGSVTTVDRFVWMRRPGADRYRLTVFDPDGSVTWSALTRDSALALPDSVALRPGQTYLWRVEARIGWDVWEPSAIAEFRVGGG
jgi:hypothetical protein